MLKDWPAAIAEEVKVVEISNDEKENVENSHEKKVEEEKEEVE